MTIILARLTSEHASAARVVHIFDPQFDQDRDGARKAHCGFEVHHDRLEIVDAFTGMPCDLCLLAAPAGAETNSLPREVPDQACEDFSGGDLSDGPTYASSLRGEPIWHDIPRSNSEARSCRYEDGTAVLTVCGLLGWVTHGEPPPDWQHCPGCIDMNERRKDL
ncbi:hypothetical protein [Actinopolyspora saharensis]|uniref:Uncharacterized protein n=1 Tax=Actinopolyspora saharensis TaxID=995062 RepID=A0A1H0YCB1_9ACTN|nr:hypothetical protein [Actinopolyspora saharensis]SDQ12835.1 hypothetical protein SAMN04489718_0369 [Actinopolyspora saharensis]